MKFFLNKIISHLKWLLPLTTVGPAFAQDFKCRYEKYSRVRSVPLGVHGCQLPALLDVDVEAAGHHVVDEPELQLALDGDGAVAALALAVHAGHGLRPGAQAGEGPRLHHLLGAHHASQVWLGLGDVGAPAAAGHTGLSHVPQQVGGGSGLAACQHGHPGYHGGGGPALAGELRAVIYNYRGQQRSVRLRGGTIKSME